jgi:hypothetical protein
MDELLFRFPQFTLEDKGVFKKGELLQVDLGDGMNEKIKEEEEQISKMTRIILSFLLVTRIATCGYLSNIRGLLENKKVLLLFCS